MFSSLGHVLDVLPTFPAGQARCCVTSPPYWGLRDYGTAPVEWPDVTFSPMAGLPPLTIPAMSASLGLEKDPWAFVGHLVSVFREVRRMATEPCPDSHFAVMPSKLAERCILAGSEVGDTVLDPFAGAGTTLATARRLGRVGIGSELNPAYLDIQERRIHKAGGYQEPMFGGAE